MSQQELKSESGGANDGTTRHKGFVLDQRTGTCQLATETETLFKKGKGEEEDG